VTGAAGRSFAGRAWAFDLSLPSIAQKRREIKRALGVLEDGGGLRRETRQPDRGRAAEIWIPVLAHAA
jgi:hypothetical protein